MKVVLVEPGKFAQIAEIDSKLESMQQIVSGMIEAFYPFEEEVCIICNDEGKMCGLPLNRAVYDENGKLLDIIAGTFFIADCSGESFDSLTDEQAQKYLKLFEFPENFISVNGKIKVSKYTP